MLAIASGPPGWALGLREAVITQGDEQVAGQLRHLDLAKNLIGADEGVPVKAIFSGTLGMLVRYVKAFGYLQMVLAVFGLVLWGRRVLVHQRGRSCSTVFFPWGRYGPVFASPKWIGDTYFRVWSYRFRQSRLGSVQAAVWCEGIAGQPRSSLGLVLRLGCLSCGCSRCFFVGLHCHMPAASALRSSRNRALDLRQHWSRQRSCGKLPRARLVEYYGDCRVSCRTAPAGRETRLHVVRAGAVTSLGDSVWLDWRNPAGRAPFEGAISNAKKLGYREDGGVFVAIVCRPDRCARPREVSGMKERGRVASPQSCRGGHETAN